MALDLYDLIDLGTELLDWRTDTPDEQERMAADLRLLAELQATTAAEAGPLGTADPIREVGWGPFWGPTQNLNP
jgi:hypothetical protein